MMRSLPLLVLVAVGCHGHSHEDGHGHGEAEELPGQSVTLWSERHELFMEYRPLVVGQESSFAAHVTVLPSFKASTAGRVTLVVERDGKTWNATSEAPSSPGIYRPVLKPDAAGACRLRVTIDDGGGPDALDAEPCEVFASSDAARRALVGEAEAPGRITYLKEQAWKTEFANEVVAERDLQPGVRASGAIRPASGHETRLTAAAPGRVVLAEPVPALGMRVARNQRLGSLAPRLAGGGDRGSLEADVAAARAELEAAEAQEQRAARLLADQAAPERQLEEARARAKVARARVDASVGRLGQFSTGATSSAGRGRGALDLVSPISGTLTAVHVTSGQLVQEGESLFTVMDLGRVWLEVQIYEPDIPAVEQATAAWFTVDGRDRPFEIGPGNGRVVAMGSALDPTTRTVPLIFEVDNGEGLLRSGQFARVVVAAGLPVRALAIPVSAIVEDAGKEVAYVQVEGEAFERRPLEVGVRSNGWVEVRAGLVAGERVVTKGAYELKLASAAGSIPAHGHAH